VRGNSALFEYQYREDKRTRTLVGQRQLSWPVSDNYDGR
jgi:hypothetical protein